MFDIKSFYEAKDVKDAVEALVREPEAEVISGGTDVLIRVREGKDAGRALVSIHNIKELKGVKVLENGDLWIGAATAFSHITNDPTIQKLVPMLGEAVDMVGDLRSVIPVPLAEISATALHPQTPQQVCGP